MSNIVDAAVQYARKCWPVFPLHTIQNGQCSCGNPECSSPGKHPRVKNGVKEATTDQQTIKDWWTRWPDANIAIATGAISGLIVLDVDPRHDGDDSLQELLNEYGSIPETVEVKTGGGGRHIFFQHPGGKIGNRANLLPGLDIRADGGYVVAAPSVHASGNPYEWELSSHPDEINIAPMPEWLLNLMRQPKMLTANNSTSHLSLVNRPSKAVIQSDVIPEGRRNDTLFRMACSLRGKGFDETQIYTALYGANVLQCIPPLPEQEVLNIVNSAMKYPVNKISEPQLIKMPGSALVPCPPPESFFDQGKFVPLLAAEFILRHSSWFYNGAQLYVYDNGVYRAVGEQRLRKLVQRPEIKAQLCRGGSLRDSAGNVDRKCGDRSR